MQAELADEERNDLIMSPDQFKISVDRLRTLLITNLPTINEKMALDATAQIKDRVVNTGINSKGSSLGKYSDNELPAFFFKDKALNAGGQKLYESRTKPKKGEERKGISYREWREANNRPTDHVTLSFSGTTMKDIGVTKQIVDGAKVVTVVGAKNTKIREGGDTTEKIVDEYLGGRYGNFLQPNDVEITRLKNYLQTQVEKLIHESFN